MSASLSVILPTYNPRLGYLEQTLDALQRQTLPATAWEFVLVDNASADPVAARVDLGWHPDAKTVDEPMRGKSHALVRGIHAARGDTLVFVDDDNLLDPDYLRIAYDFAENRPWLGAWGAGRIVPKFEVVPDPKLRRYLGRLALREYEQEHWSNNVQDWLATPVGAGLCLRRQIADYWASRFPTEFAPSTSVERVGGDLVGGEDIIMALSARHFGLGWATSPALAITHLIPSQRVTRSYLLEITEGNAALDVLIRPHTARARPTPTSNIKHIYQILRLALQGHFVDIEFLRARERGIRRGEATLAAQRTTARRCR